MATESKPEIDISAPFESVKEAANRFGGMGFWKPINTNTHHHHNPNSEHASQYGEEMIEIATQLETDVISKERETLDVLKELETTKKLVEQLKLMLHKEASSQIDVASLNVSQQGNHEAPGTIVQELKQAELNLTRTTTDIANIRSTVDLYNKKLEKQRMLSLDKTRQRWSSNTSKVSSLEEELNQIRHEKLEMVKEHPLNVTSELQTKLCSETEQFKDVGEAAKSQVLRAMSEIEQTKTKIKIAEIRLVAAKKMKAAARASEAVALAEIKALSNSDNAFEGVTLSFEEYSLISKAREAEEACKGRVVDAMLQIDEANVSKTEMLKKVEAATEEVKISKKALEEALSRVEVANQGKLEVEEALRERRFENVEKRRNSIKLKNSVDVIDELQPVVVKSTPSIGQILSRKLLLTEEYKKKGMGKGKVPLSKPNADLHSANKCGKENRELLLVHPENRKKFGFGGIFMTKQSKKKKKKKQKSATT